MIHLRVIEIVRNARAVRVEKPVIIEYWRICPTVYVLMLLLSCYMIFRSRFILRVFYVFNCDTRIIFPLSTKIFTAVFILPM